MEPIARESTELRPMGNHVDGGKQQEVSQFQKARNRFADLDWKKIILVSVICVGNFIVFCSISLIGAFFPTEALDKGSSLFATGIIIAMAPLSATIFAPVFGYFLPKLSIKYSMTGALIVVGVSYILLGVTIYLPSGIIFILICGVLRFIEGFGTSLYNTTIIALLAHLYPNSLGTVFGIKQTATGLGYATGPAIGGVLYLAGGYVTPFFVVGGLCIVFTVPIFILTGKVPSTELSRRVLPIKSLLQIMTNIIATMLVMARVILHAGLGFLVATYAVFVKEQFNLTPSQTGLLFLTISVPYVIFASLGGLIADKINTRLNNIIGLILSGIGFQIVGPTTLTSVQPVLWLTVFGLLLIGIGLGIGVVSFPGVYAVLSRDMGHSDALKGIVGGLSASAVAVGELVGPIIGGGLTTLIGFQASTSVYGEIEIFWMILLSCMSVIDYYIRKRTSYNTSKSKCNSSGHDKNKK